MSMYAPFSVAKNICGTQNMGGGGVVLTWSSKPGVGVLTQGGFLLQGGSYSDLGCNASEKYRNDE